MSESEAVRSKDFIRTIIEADVRSEAGSIIVPKGHKLNEILISRVRNYHLRVPVVEPIKVRKDKPSPPQIALEDTRV